MIGISHCHTSPEPIVQNALCRLFAQHHINLTFITTRKIDDENTSFFYCVNAEDRSRTEQLIKNTASDFHKVCRVIPALTLLSVFPHQSDTRIVFQLMEILWRAQIQTHAIASSIAALTLVIDTNQIGHTVEALKRSMNIQP